jgi:hypothetical protein
MPDRVRRSVTASGFAWAAVIRLRSPPCGFPATAC